MRTTLAGLVLALSIAACDPPPPTKSHGTGGTGGTGGVAEAGSGGMPAGGSGGLATGGSGGDATGGSGGTTDPCPGAVPKTSDPRVKEMYRWLADFRAASGAPGALLGVIVDGKVIHVGAQGYERGEDCEPMKLTSSYYVATKLHTALVMGIAEKQGIVDLDAPVDAPGIQFTGDWPHPTLAQLLGMAGGIPRHTGYICGSPGGDASLEELLKQEQITRWAPPGEVAYYSNASLAVAARALEVAYGKSFATATRETLTVPLGLSLGWDVQSVTLGSSEDEAVGDVCPFNQPIVVLATIGDMVRMLQLALDGGEGLIDPATLDRLFDEGLPYDYSAAPFSSGLAFERIDTPQGPFYRQSNTLFGGSSVILIADRERKLGIVLFLNLIGFDQENMVNQMLRIWGRTVPTLDVARQIRWEDYAGRFDITVPDTGYPDAFIFGVPDDVEWTHRMYLRQGSDTTLVTEITPTTVWKGIRPLDAFNGWPGDFRLVFHRDATGKVVSVTTPYTPPYKRREP